MGISLKLICRNYNKAWFTLTVNLAVTGLINPASSLDESRDAKDAAVLRPSFARFGQRPPGRETPEKVGAARPFRAIIRAWTLPERWFMAKSSVHKARILGTRTNSYRGDFMMTVLFWPLVVWGVLTTLLIILIIYRSTLTMQEDDQLFLNDSASQMEKDQIEILNKVQKISPYVRWLGASSGVLILVIGGIALYHGLNQDLN
jgi:hypothetical protein